MTSASQVPAVATSEATAAPARRIRVMRIIDRLIVGGPTKNAVYLTAGLDHRRFESLLVSGVPAAGEVAASDFVADAGIEPVEIPKLSRELGLRDLFVCLRLFREMRRFRPDIVHTHKSKAGATGRVAALAYRWLTPGALILRPRRCRVLHTFHGHIFHSYYGPFKTKVFITIERILGRFCTDRIITISAQQRREICDTFHIARPEQFVLLPIGIDFSQVRGEPGAFRREFNIGADEVLVSNIGRLTEVKNYDLFLEAAAFALRTSPEIPFRFAIVGEGNLRPNLEAKAESLGIADRVLFTGVRKDVGNVYADSDLIALSSLNEGTPLTVLEGMASGKPVVSTEVGGVVDLLGRRGKTVEGCTDWEFGITVASGDAPAFAHALCRMAQFPAEHRGSMGARARESTMRCYSKERLIADIERLYSELAG